MFLSVLALLTTEQKHALHEAGIDRHLLSAWRHGARLPTEPQAVILAGIAGVEVTTLQAEMAIARSTDAQRPLVERVLKKARGGAATLAIFGAAALAAGVATVESARHYVYRGKHRRRSTDNHRTVN